MTEPTIPRGVREKLLFVVRDTGEHYLLEKEPLEGIENWVAGQNVIVLEYAFSRVVYAKP